MGLQRWPSTLRICQIVNPGFIKILDRSSDFNFLTNQYNAVKAAEITEAIPVLERTAPKTTLRRNQCW